MIGGIENMIEIIDSRDATPEEIKKHEEQPREQKDWREAMLRTFLAGH